MGNTSNTHHVGHNGPVTSFKQLLGKPGSASQPNGGYGAHGGFAPVGSVGGFTNGVGYALSGYNSEKYSYQK